MYKFGRYTLLFIIYSLLGTLGETLFRLVTEHQLYGIHGYLQHLPFMPIYGFGALAIIAILGRIRHVAILFIVGAIVATILEFAASFLIEMIFHNRIWDYSDSQFNLYGRVALHTSIAFGLAAALLVHFIHPFVLKQVKRLPKRQTLIAAGVSVAIVLADTVVSTINRFQAM
jgi:uncharacterized membrane protein